MAFYVVQHGKCFSKDQDPEKGLTPEGIADVERVADVAKGYGVPVDLIGHSGKKRARQTAEILEARLSPTGGVEARDGMNPMDDVTVLAKTLEPDANLMLVGHLPFLEKLVSHLVIGNREHRVFKLQNGGILGLDREAGGDFWFIKWGLMPKVG